MKRLKFKKPFNGMDNAKKLIPESYKIDGNEFEMTDGNETYRIKWESSINESTILSSSNKTQINEDMKKMKHLMGFKSQDTLGTVKGAARLEENTKFNDILGKSKKLLNEMTGGMGFTGEGNLEGNESIEESDDVDALTNAMDNSAVLKAAAKKINTKDEKMEASIKYVNAIVGDNDALKQKIARELMKKGDSSEESTEVTNTSMTNESEDDENVDYTMGKKDDPNQLPNPPKEIKIDEELENPELADIDDNGEISSYEEKRGKAVEKAVKKDRFDEIFDGYDNDADEEDSIIDDEINEVE